MNCPAICSQLPLWLTDVQASPTEATCRSFYLPLTLTTRLAIPSYSLPHPQAPAPFSVLPAPQARWGQDPGAQQGPGPPHPRDGLTGVQATALSQCKQCSV